MSLIRLPKLFRALIEAGCPPALAEEAAIEVADYLRGRKEHDDDRRHAILSKLSV